MQAAQQNELEAMTDMFNKCARWHPPVHEKKWMLTPVRHDCCAG